MQKIFEQWFLVWAGLNLSWFLKFFCSWQPSNPIALKLVVVDRSIYFGEH
jgi:hypothetical protein